MGTNLLTENTFWNQQGYQFWSKIHKPFISLVSGNSLVPIILCSPVKIAVCLKVWQPLATTLGVAVLQVQDQGKSSTPWPCQSCQNFEIVLRTFQVYVISDRQQNCGSKVPTTNVIQKRRKMSIFADIGRFSEPFFWMFANLNLFTEPSIRLISKLKTA